MGPHAYWYADFHGLATGPEQTAVQLRGPASALAGHVCARADSMRRPPGASSGRSKAIAAGGLSSRPADCPQTASDSNSALPEGQPRDDPARIAGGRRDNRHTRQTEGLQRGSPSASGVGPVVVETRASCPGSYVRALQARGRLMSDTTYG